MKKTTSRLIPWLLEARADDQGRITAASIWTKWKGWEFCQKREPSYWLTFLYHRAAARMKRTGGTRKAG